MLYEKNNGTLRWFAVIGAMVGMFFYKLCIGRFFVKYVSFILRKIIIIIGRLLYLLGTPIRKIGIKSGGIYRRIRHSFVIGKKIIKNRLTSFIKMVKIILCKQ